MNKKEIKKILEATKIPEERLESLVNDLYEFNVFLTRNFPDVSVLNVSQKEAKDYSIFLEKKGKNKKMHYINLKDFAYYMQNSELYNVILELLNSGSFLKNKKHKSYLLK